jgi:guanylate kinase
VSLDEFESLVQADGFLEHTVFSNNRYGTSKKTIEEQMAKGKVVILDIEMNGLAKIKSQFDVRSVFISPPSLQELQSRLESRATESNENIQRRVAQASIEMENAEKPGVHDNIIINNNLDKACEELEQWILGQHGQS